MTERAPSLMPLYQLFMLALCVLALAGIVLQYVFRHDPEIEQILDAADFVICIAFSVTMKAIQVFAPGAAETSCCLRCFRSFASTLGARHHRSLPLPR
ncbi:MAG TPA: hypothetical protein VEK57_28830 [Thermoanaerobaculia bacterium]|nr:hypothetical protein [Thermoanaerobaculia bacterium]